MNEKTKRSQLKYECSFLKLYEDEVELDNGKSSQRIVLKHPGGASVLPITHDGKIILTKQYRYPIASVSIEIPAGKKDYPNEDGLTCAKRELEEETGYMSSNWKLMFEFHPCVGYSDEKLDIYIALDCTKKHLPKAMDEDEHIDLMVIEPNDIKALLKSNIITDGKTIIALQYYMLHLAVNL
jgi:ADP-ribose pyrophosphatase